MHEPVHWTAAQLNEDTSTGRDRFQAERLDEPLELYSKFFDAFVPIFEQLIAQVGQLADPDLLEGIMTDADTRLAFRYLTAPPISEDDLKTLADAKMSPTALRKDPEAARRLTDVVLHILDPKRFPWIVEDRDPQAGELRTATVASAALAAAQRVQTRRRNEAKSVQEKEVKQFLRELGFAEVARRPISNLRDAPDPGQCCSECKLGSSRADMVVGLHDRRVLAIECKASNSEVNSFKRINHEAVGKARS